MSELRYLFDTNIISAIVKQPNSALAHRIAMLDNEIFCTSIIVASELRFGAYLKNSLKLTAQVEAVLSGFNIMPLEEPVDEYYGMIRTHLQRLGQPIGQNDLFIAAHARALDVILVTNNEGEFIRVPELLIENWLK
jgi:tRNA(fMet)-specific endonuclease VapC